MDMEKHEELKRRYDRRTVVYEKRTKMWYVVGHAYQGRIEVFPASRGNYALMRIQGGRVWVAQGVYDYAPSELHLLRILDVKEDEDRIVYECVIEAEFDDITVTKKRKK